MPTLIRLLPDSPPGEGVDFSAIFDAIPQPLAYIGPGHRLDACNRCFRELFPALIEERLLQSLSSTQTVTLNAAVPGSREGRDKPLRLPGPQVPPLVVKGQPLRPHTTPMADGGLLVSFENVQPPPNLESRSLVAGLRAELDDAHRALARARTSAEARKMALTSASHELRTPLNAILGFSEMMQQEVFGPLGHERYREYATMIRESGGYLLELVNNLLDLAHVDAGKARLRLDRVEVLKVVVDCVKAMEPQASRAGVGMSVRVYDGVEQIVGDDLRLHQMVLNLLSNAVKFTRMGGEACIDIFRRGRFVAISVSDTGAGISQADMARVLEPFERAESVRGRIPGTGLGLPLTRALAHLHGGELTLESVVNQGSTFTILLPPEGPARASETKQRAALRGAGHNTMTHPAV